MLTVGVKKYYHLAFKIHHIAKTKSLTHLFCTAVVLRYCAASYRCFFFQARLVHFPAKLANRVLTPNLPIYQRRQNILEGDF